MRAPGFEGNSLSGKGASRGSSTAPSTTPQVQTVPASNSAPSTSQVDGPPVRRQVAQAAPTSQQPQQRAAQGKAKSSIEAVVESSVATSTSMIGEYRESRSLGSNAQTLLQSGYPGHGSADRARSADVLTSRVDEALMRLTVRVDEAIIELRAELPRARSQIERQQIEIERLADEQDRNRVEFMARFEELEKRVADDSAHRERLAGTVLETRNELSDRISADGASLEALLKRLNDEVASRADLSQNFFNEVALREEMQKSQAQSLDLLEKNLAEETEARFELEKVLGKDLREHVALEVDGIREMAMREMRERMDGQKVLREEVQLQQQALMGLTSRVDETLIELRTEVPCLKQELTAQKAEADRLSDAQSTSIARLEHLERTLSNEGKSRLEAERGLSADFRERLADQEKKSALRSSEVSAKVMELSSRLEALQEETSAEVLKTSSEVHECQRNMTTQLRSVQDSSAEQASQLSRQLTDVETNSRGWSESKIRECEAALQSWVETTAVARLTELERTLKKEMAERAGAIKDVLDRTAHNTERWCQLQAKFDEILIEVL